MSPERQIPVMLMYGLNLIVAYVLTIQFFSGIHAGFWGLLNLTEDIFIFVAQKKKYINE